MRTMGPILVPVFISRINGPLNSDPPECRRTVHFTDNGFVLFRLDGTFWVGKTIIGWSLLSGSFVETYQDDPNVRCEWHGKSDAELAILANKLYLPLRQTKQDWSDLGGFNAGTRALIFKLMEE